MTYFALVDADAFYASCERLFDLAITDLPVVVLSSNDGNVIARSKEAKALGIEMGERLSVLRARQCTQRIVVRSANFTLYGDISRRVMGTIRTLAARMEEYSIDEAFVDAGDVNDVLAYARAIRERVRRWCGIPVSIGLGPTKVLAKVATRVAKKNADCGGVYACPADEGNLVPLLSSLPVEDLWGVADATRQRLAALGIHRADELRRADPSMIRSSLGVVGERLVWELRGVSCLPLVEHPPARQSLAVTRTFGRPVYTLADARCAIAAHVQRAAEKLRACGMVTARVSILIHTSPFAEAPVVHAGGTLSLPVATNDTARLLEVATGLLDRTFSPGQTYVGGGCICLSLSPASARQESLFAGDPRDRRRRDRLLEVVDLVNRVQRGTVVFASSLGHQRLQPRSQWRSPSYTTRWSDLPTVS